MLMGLRSPTEHQTGFFREGWDSLVLDFILAVVGSLLSVYADSSLLALPFKVPLGIR